MDIPVFIMVGEWRCKEEEWKFKLKEDMFGRCVRVKENMTYTEFVRTLSEAFSLKSTEINPIISYRMPGEIKTTLKTIKQMRMKRRGTTKMVMGMMIIRVTMDLWGEVPSILLLMVVKVVAKIMITTKEHGIGNVEENVILTPGEFSPLLAECTSTSQRVPDGDNISHSGDRTPAVTPRNMCKHGLYHCTYTIDWEVFLRTE
uniref:Mutator-like transposase n=1 Tax=Arabidopsis thaliana TaxID=3702 RepID=Q9SLD7_ARATH|nr:Mutator-like transposase [Arabidopsis thaliana]